MIFPEQNQPGKRSKDAAKCIFGEENSQKHARCAPTFTLANVPKRVIIVY